MNRKQLVAKSSSSLIHTNYNGKICLELVKLLKLAGVVLMISNISVVVCLRYLYLHLPSFRRDKTTKIQFTSVTVLSKMPDTHRHGLSGRYIPPYQETK